MAPEPGLLGGGSKPTFASHAALAAASEPLIRIGGTRSAVDADTATMTTRARSIFSKSLTVMSHLRVGGSASRSSFENGVERWGRG
eukprot:5427979-Prymnesium_polylepis.1